MKRRVCFILMLLALIGFVFCVFVGCKKEKHDGRQFDVQGDGTNNRIYVNNSLTSHQIPSGYVSIKKGDVLSVLIDTSIAFQTCSINLRIFDEQNVLIDQVERTSNTNLSITYTIK